MMDLPPNTPFFFSSSSSLLPFAFQTARPPSCSSTPPPTPAACSVCWSLTVLVWELNYNSHRRAPDYSSQRPADTWTLPSSSYRRRWSSPSSCTDLAVSRCPSGRCWSTCGRTPSAWDTGRHSSTSSLSLPRLPPGTLRTREYKLEDNNIWFLSI